MIETLLWNITVGEVICALAATLLLRETMRRHRAEAGAPHGHD